MTEGPEGALAYVPCGYSFAQLQPEAESTDYAACTLLLIGLRVQYRVGRGPIQPFELSDPVDLARPAGSTRNDRLLPTRHIHRVARGLAHAFRAQ